MKNRTALALTELCIMLLVLALTAALCLRVFLWADATSRENAVRDGALVQMQNAAEVLKATKDYEAAARLLGGHWDGRVWTLSVETYEIRVTPAAAGAGLGAAYLEAVYAQQVVAGFTVCWQEVGYEKK